MQMILNELSASFPVNTREEGKMVMANFLKVCQEVRKILLNDSMILDKDYNVFLQQIIKKLENKDILWHI